LMMAACMTAAGCGWCKKPAPPKLFPVPLCLHASHNLQWYNERPHTLYVRVFPLVINDAFAAAEVNDLLADPPPTLPGSAGIAQSRTLYPDTTQTLSFDAEGGKPFSFLGIVAGYYKPLGATKHVVRTEELRQEGCYTVEFGAAGIQGGQPASTAPPANRGAQ